MFPMTITIYTPEMFKAAEAALAQFFTSDQKGPSVAHQEAKPGKKSAQTQASTASTAPTAQAQQGAVSESTGANSAQQPALNAEGTGNQQDAWPFKDGLEASEPVTYEQAAAAVTALARSKGRDAAVAVLQQFGAAKLPDVKPEQFAAVVAACQAAGA